MYSLLCLRSEVDRSVVALGTYSCLTVTNLLPLLVLDSTLASRLIETLRHMVQACQLPRETSDVQPLGSFNPVCKSSYIIVRLFSIVLYLEQ